MNRIVREHYPVGRLPEDLREGLVSGAEVRVTIEEIETRPEPVMTLEEMFAMADRHRVRSGAEIDADLRSQRDEWDD